MRSARPKPLAGEVGRDTSPRAVASRGAADGKVIQFERFEVDTPSDVPFRTHGQVFFKQGAFNFACSATVVVSENKSLVWTAAHCMHDKELGGFSSQVVFVPAYKDGSAPFGQWVGDQIAVPAKYKNTKDTTYDYAAFTVLEQTDAIGDVVGMRGIAFNQSPAEFIRSYGYPAQPSNLFDGERMISCESKGSGRIYGSMVSMGCDMEQGSSGGGWIMRGGYLVSNVSGGAPGTYPKTAWGPYLGQGAKDIYNELRGGSGPIDDTLPPTDGTVKKHAVEVDFDFSKHLVAKGVVKVPDGFGKCKFLTPVRFFRKQQGVFKQVGKITFANKDGSFTAKLPDKPGDYFADTDETRYDLRNLCKGSEVFEVTKHQH
jgi:V8-like Glu-specific endopeptidase